MKRIFAILAAMAMLLAFGACTMSRADREVETALVRADSLMESRPDSALALLTALDHSSIRSDALRARYALGLYHARFKNYEETADDSLITFAANYYDGRRGCRREQMLSHYFQARAMYNAGQYPTATFSVMLCAEYAFELGSAAWEARANDLLADICHSTYCVNEEVRFRNRAAELFYSCDSIRNAQCSMIEAAKAMIDDANYEAALSVLDKITPEISPSDSMMLGYAAEAYTRVYINLDSVGMASHYLNLMDSCSYLGDNLVDAYMKARVAILRGDTIDTRNILDKMKTCFPDSLRETVFYLYPLFCYYQKTGQPDSAIVALKQLYQIQNQELRRAMRQSAVVAQRNYLEQESERQSSELKNNRMFTVGIIIILFLSVILFSGLYRYNSFKRKAELDIAISNLEHFKSDFDKLAIENREGKDGNMLYEAVFLRQQQALDELCNKIHKHSSATEFSDLRMSLSLALKDISSEDTLDKLVMIFNLRHSGIIDLLKKEQPRLKSKDIYLFVLYGSGLSARSISLILDIQFSGFYTKLSRLKSKIERMESPRRDEILYFLTKGEP